MRKVEGEEAVAGMDSGMNNHGAPAFFHTFRSAAIFIIDKIAVNTRIVHSIQYTSCISLF